VDAVGLRQERLHAVIGRDTQLRLAFLAAPSSDEYDAVGATHSENSRRGGVFKYRNGRYLVRV